MTLDDIRANIVAERDRAMRVVEREQRVVDCKVAELEAHDRAVEAMAAGGARRNIAELVLARLTSEPQTVGDLSMAIAAQPRQITEALGRLHSSHKVDETPSGWIRVSGLELGDGR